MQRFDGLQYADPLDLLRRFVATPLTSVYRIGATNVLVKTNDNTLLPSLEANSEATGVNNFEWTLIRDADCNGLLQPPLCINCGPLTVVGMGPACLVGVDRERREIIAFIGRDIDTQTHQETLIPLFCELTIEASSGNICSEAIGDE